MPFKKLIFRGTFRKIPEGWYPQTMSKFLFLKSLITSIKTKTSAEAVQETDFWGFTWGGTQSTFKHLTIKYLQITKTLKL